MIRTNEYAPKIYGNQAKKSFLIKGVVADFYSGSFRKKVKTTIIYPFDFKSENDFKVLQLRLKHDLVAPTVNEIKASWEATFPNIIFNFSFIREEFIQLHRNYKEVAEIGALLPLSVFF